MAHSVYLENNNKSASKEPYKFKQGDMTYSAYNRKIGEKYDRDIAIKSQAMTMSQSNNQNGMRYSNYNRFG